MNTIREPQVLLLVLGVMIGVAVVVVTLLRMGGDEEPTERFVQNRPDRRAKRLDEAVEKSPFLRRAVRLTANLAERRGLLGSVERSLRAADVPIRPAEMLLAHFCAIVVIPAAVFYFTRSIVFMVFMLLLLGAGPMYGLKVIVATRRKRFAAQLPDALTVLAGSLRAGRSIGQAMESLSRELPDPMGRELRKVVAETRLGRSLAEALSDASDRIDSPDFRWAVLAMQIQAEVGGNLAELLDQVAVTMRERLRMKGEVKALTAEGRASALMLVVLVPGLGLVMSAVNRDYMAPLITTTIGHVILGVSFVMITGGYFWMNKMIKIDV
jgi:tight adherence protein B